MSVYSDIAGKNIIGWESSGPTKNNASNISEKKSKIPLELLPQFGTQRSLAVEARTIPRLVKILIKWSLSPHFESIHVPQALLDPVSEKSGILRFVQLEPKQKIPIGCDALYPCEGRHAPAFELLARTTGKTDVGRRRLNVSPNATFRGLMSLTGTHRLAYN